MTVDLRLESSEVSFKNIKNVLECLFVSLVPPLQIPPCKFSDNCQSSDSVA